VFGGILISIVTLMHLHVFWRLGSVPLVARRVRRGVVAAAGLVLWLMFVSGRLYGHGGSGPMAVLLEVAGMNWMAVVFLCFISLTAIELVTGFGWLMPRIAPSLRGGSLAIGVVLSLIGFVQGVRAPVWVRYEVGLAHLPPELDGTVLVALSDLHLGQPLLDRDWLARRVEQVRSERPDIVVLSGDVLEGHGHPANELLQTLGELGSGRPLGAWAVLGNHEWHGNPDRAAGYLTEAGFEVLRNRWVEVRPGLILAGVDDLTSLSRAGRDGQAMPRALSGRPGGATILLSHTPWQAEQAASLGVGLMLSGHTHGGQVWPFGYLARLRYPLLAGRYEIDGMTTIVSRGTGVWGPRMRLWRPAEILHLTLRRK